MCFFYEIYFELHESEHVCFWCSLESNWHHDRGFWCFRWGEESLSPWVNHFVFVQGVGLLGWILNHFKMVWFEMLKILEVTRTTWNNRCAYKGGLWHDLTIGEKNKNLSGGCLLKKHEWNAIEFLMIWWVAVILHGVTGPSWTWPVRQGNSFSGPCYLWPRSNFFADWITMINQFLVPYHPNIPIWGDMINNYMYLLVI